MPQATTKAYQLFRETLLNATSEEHRNDLDNWLSEEDKPYINLEDVLMALNDRMGIEVFTYIVLICKWQLTKPAHLQSEETLLEIIKLLK